jgi:predicted TIM-barrel fold metal-dependent hydrolase
MIVDCHTHISSPAGREQDIAERLAAQVNVDKCLVLANPDESSERTNSQLAGFVSKYSQRMVGFGFVDPVGNGFGKKYIAMLTEKHGLKGAVLYCSACDFHPAHTKAMRLYEHAQEAGVPVFFHNGGDISPGGSLKYAQPYLLDEIANEFKDLKIIIGNMGYPFLEQTLMMAANHPNVYADLTVKVDRPWQLYTTVIAAFESGVLDKLLFGSGFPCGDAASAIEALLGFNKRLGDTNLPTVPRDQLRKIVERDSLQLLGISQ